MHESLWKKIDLVDGFANGNGFLPFAIECIEVQILAKI